MEIRKQIHRAARVLCGVFLLMGQGLGYSLEEGQILPLLEDFAYRNLGPFRAGAWIGDIAVPRQQDSPGGGTFYVAARTGGVWKTVNNGTTFFPIFDDYGVNAIGAVEVAPSDSAIVWVGTGDDSYARSSYAGNGIYRSGDGGEHFEHMGLPDSHHIGRIVIHPENPAIVYAAVMGHLFSDNSQRGVFRTTDGGCHWEKVLYISEKVGVVDLGMNPLDPSELFAASYEKTRTPWHYEAGGNQSRIYRSRDGGDTWEMLTAGLPDGQLGRIGIDIHRADPDIIYAVIQNLNPRPSAMAGESDTFDPFTDHSYDHLVGGEVYRSDDGGESWEKVSEPGVDVSGKAAYSFNEIYVDPHDPDRVYIIGVFMQYSSDGGRTWPQSWKDRELFRNNFGDVRTFWIDPQDPRHMMLGSDGGFYQTYDRGVTTSHHYQIPLGEVYRVAVDRQQPYNIYAGLQDHEIWKGPVNGWSGSVGLEDWVIVGLWDGMYCSVNPRDNRWLYFTSQFGKHHRVDQWRGTRVEITPRAPEGQPPYRYTWTTPLVLSPHNPDILYTGGQMLLRSLDRGRHWEEISPDLTTDDPVKIAGQGHMMYCTITTISESPRKSGTIWVGTDDGRVHVTTDHGARWEEMTARIDELGDCRDIWVSCVTASGHDPGRAYVVKSGYRRDVFRPLVFRTEDLGRHWQDISGGLPEAPVSVIVEDRVNPNLLLAGTDAGVYFSLDRGEEWISLRLNMPPVPVRDLKVQPDTGDLVVGSYGRGIWVANISPLQKLTDDLLGKAIHLFTIRPRPVNNRSHRARWGNYQMTGDNHLRTPNEPEGLRVDCYVRRKGSRAPQLIVKDIRGKVVRTLKIPNRRGIHRMVVEAPGGRPGTYRFVLRGAGEEISRLGVFTPALHWPVGRLHLSAE